MKIILERRRKFQLTSSLDRQYSAFSYQYCFKDNEKLSLLHSHTLFHLWNEGINFTNILHAAFMHEDPKRLTIDCIFCAFGICARKNF